MLSGMKLRIFTEPQQGASYEQQLRVAQAVQGLGFDAFSAPTTTWGWAATACRGRPTRG
jgi:hypothetical protein